MSDGIWWSRVMDPAKWECEIFTPTGVFSTPQGPATVYLEWHDDPLGPLIPGRLLPPTIEYEGRTYQFDGMEAKRARYTRVPS